jgi:hypothetical protein
MPNVQARLTSTTFPRRLLHERLYLQSQLYMVLCQVKKRSALCCSLKFGIRGQRRKTRFQNRRRSCSGRSGTQATRRKSLISMIISDNSASFFERTGQLSLQPTRQSQKRQEILRTAAGGVYSSRASVAGAAGRTSRTKSHHYLATAGRILDRINMMDRMAG